LFFYFIGLQQKKILGVKIFYYLFQATFSMLVGIGGFCFYLFFQLYWINLPALKFTNQKIALKKEFGIAKYIY
jgi:hypothetical protein